MMNTTTEPLTGNFAIVERTVRQQAPDFANLGLELTSIILAGSPKLQVFPTFHLLNKQTNIALDISFFEPCDGRKGGFAVMIVKPVNRKMSVKKYLKEHGREELASAFEYHDPTDVREFAEGFLRMLLDLISKDLRPILEGKVWEETPIDWMGYK